MKLSPQALGASLNFIAICFIQCFLFVDIWTFTWICCRIQLLKLYSYCKIGRSTVTYPETSTFEFSSKFLSCCCWSRDWLVFQNTNFSHANFKLKKKLHLLMLIGEESAFQMFCDCWNICCQSDSNYWSRQLFQTDVLACVGEKCVLAFCKILFGTYVYPENICHAFERCVTVKIRVKCKNSLYMLRTCSVDHVLSVNS